MPEASRYLVHEPLIVWKKLKNLPKQHEYKQFEDTYSSSMRTLDMSSMLAYAASPLRASSIFFLKKM